MFNIRSAVLACMLFLYGFPASASWVSPFISEIHYDNAGPDIDEFVAISGPGGLTLSGWQLALYNGADGGAYKTLAVDGRFDSAVGTWSEMVWPLSGVQNGPDAIALISAAAEVIDFVAYEGAVNGVTGAAAGLAARVLPLSEGGTTPVGTSLQRTGKFDDWNWISATASAGQLNPGLQFTSVTAVPIGGTAGLSLAALAAWWMMPGLRSGRRRL